MTDEATRFDSTSADALLAEMAAAAVAERTLASLAPAEVSAAHEVLAAASEELVAGVQGRAPQTMEEVLAAVDEAWAPIEVKYGDLTVETAAVTAYVKKQCGLDINQG